MTATKTAERKKADAPPWEQANPKGKDHDRLSPSAKAAARKRAKKAGRPYPNLVDNMNAAKERKK